MYLILGEKFVKFKVVSIGTKKKNKNEMNKQVKTDKTANDLRASSAENFSAELILAMNVFEMIGVEFCKGARQSGLVSVCQHSLVGQWLQGFL